VNVGCPYWARKIHNSCRSWNETPALKLVLCITRVPIVTSLGLLTCLCTFAQFWKHSMRFLMWTDEIHNFYDIIKNNLYTWPHGRRKDFSRGGVVKLNSTNSETKKHFYTKRIMANHQISKSSGKYPSSAPMQNNFFSLWLRYASCSYLFLSSGFYTYIHFLGISTVMQPCQFVTWIVLCTFIMLACNADDSLYW